MSLLPELRLEHNPSVADLNPTVAASLKHTTTVIAARGDCHPKIHCQCYPPNITPPPSSLSRFGRKRASYNQSYRAGEAKGQAEEKTGQMMDKARKTKDQTGSYLSDKAGAAKEKAAQMGQSTKETAEARKEETGGVMKRTTEQVKSMAQGAADKVKQEFGGDVGAATTTTTNNTNTTKCMRIPTVMHGLFSLQSDTCKEIKMPNDRRSSSHRYRASPYSVYNKKADKRRPKSPSLPIGNENEWEETRCSICMEHPHNAVLLLCSSREKGCLPYICDTSARHSNCLDQFQKTFMNSEGEQTKLVCPLCRGQINKWIVVNPARQFMNSKTRSCSMGTCDFSGNYSQLREHARRQHPFARPTDVDPERELEWTKLEQEMEQQDMLSMQFEFDDDDAIEIMDGFYELASPIWDPDLNMMNFFTAFESEFGSIFSELDMIARDSNLFLNDWDNAFNLSSSSSSSHESEIEGSGRSRGPASTHNRFSGMPRENA
ncbi:hypothetical protein L1987_49599 [Smallanthus sonchifolius]|uniref:Uncharacterized protein n=1 Tax=Smallanthus sonchifolius TaxID=185202 RepID=A0ACB9FW76_9ASTR|nr:hypothetical protein L1987_49599 [Smallanthus sonchifolius]